MGKQGRELPLTNPVELEKLVDRLLGHNLCESGLGRNSKINLMAAEAMWGQGLDVDIVVRLKGNKKDHPECIYTPGGLRHLIQSAVLL